MEQSLFDIYECDVEKLYAKKSFIVK